MRLRRPVAILAEHITNDELIQEQIKWQPTAETRRSLRLGYWVSGLALASLAAWGAWTDANSNNIGNNGEAAVEGLVTVGIVADLGCLAAAAVNRNRVHPAGEPKIVTEIKE